MKIVKWLIVGPIVLFVFFFIILVLSEPKTKSESVSKELSLKPDQIETIKMLEKERIIKINVEFKEVQIRPSYWHQMDVTTKEGLSRALAIYVGNKEGKKSYWVSINNIMNGKRLAKYSESWGFTVD